MNIDASLRGLLIQQFGELQAFRFSPANPVFWGILFLLFLVLSNFWDAKKSISFCLFTAGVLFVDTWLERSLAAFFRSGNEAFEPTLFRIISVLLIALAFLYYSWMRKTR